MSLRLTSWSPDGRDLYCRTGRQSEIVAADQTTGFPVLAANQRLSKTPALMAHVTWGHVLGRVQPIGSAVRILKVPLRHAAHTPWKLEGPMTHTSPAPTRH
jgi:hypothetical protein